MIEDDIGLSPVAKNRSWTNNSQRVVRVAHLLGDRKITTQAYKSY